MGIFSGKGTPSIDAITRHTINEMERLLGSSDSVADGRFDKNYEELLSCLAEYSQRHNLSLWKKSRIPGVIEAVLRDYLPPEACRVLVRRAYERFYK